MSESVKRIISFVAAVFFLILCSLMFFPWIDWEEQESITGTVKTLTISQSKYGSQPIYLIDLESGRTVRVKAPSSSNLKEGDMVELRLFTGKDNDNLRRYALKIPITE